ncbi:PP2C family protein-serine/threonine phosphatase [Streptomyces sp. CB00455]|uniref:PP2C family protein-serine/threonine phosphatase n=1 Tax=Streptomyces sp. CB00455 TaxID=1703927 RepID=UPI000A41056A|nr:PP2C family protein-serine/threonine phosphatase [Streptomyces sp. CB00455]
MPEPLGHGTRRVVTGVEDAEFGRLLGALLQASHRLDVDDLPGALRSAVRAMGLHDAAILLVDVQQTRLIPLTGEGSGPQPRGTPDPAGPAEAPEASRTGLAVDGTLAGWVYRTGSLQLSTGAGLVLWLPLVDGVERLGVLRFTAPSLDAVTLERCKVLASLFGELVATKSAFSDTVPRTVRTRPMSIQAELAWAFMPPRTIGSHRATSSAVLEPAYRIGGDAFDHTLSARTLHVTLVDAMGHDLASGLCAAVALAGCRSTRRADGGLPDITVAVDDALNRWIPDRLLTAVFADLDLETGALSWVNRGHPPPLLIRGHHVVPGALSRTPQLPLGLGPRHGPPAPSTVHHAQLEPGDRILVHTDGVTEARSATGELFGEERLIDTVVRATAAGEAAPEALRRLIRAILDHHDDRLCDDATILLAEWHPHREPAPAGGADGLLGAVGAPEPAGAPGT